VKRTTFLVTGLLVALLIAGGASFYASSHPDGLEYVAEQTGFLDTAEDSPTADGPFADYSTKGVDDERISGGVAGVAGSVLVLALAGSLFWVLRRRTPARASAATSED
jgi:cobalt/nickel transport system permease protein/cobalt/nickel transport protein